MTMPTRTFEAEVGIPSEGTAGPNQIEWDLDNIFAMFNPAAMTRDGQPGGIGHENLRDDAATDRVIGDRTISDAEAPTGDTGPLTVILGWLAHQIKAILGSSSWRDQPARTLAEISATVGAAGLLAGVATDAAIGERTVDQTKLPISDTGTLTELLGRLANRIRALSGAADWKDAPAATLADLKSHMDAAAPHSGHETPSGAQAKVDAHAALTANVHGVDSSGFESKAGAQAKVDAHANRKDNPHQVTAAQTGALVSVDGVSSPGGNIDLVAGLGIAITPDPVNRTITITATGEAASIPAEHAFTHAIGGDDPITPGMIGAETPEGAQAKVDAHANRKDNPHGVTPEQIGAETPAGAQAKVDAHANRKDNPHQVTALQVGALRRNTDDTMTGDLTLAKKATGSAIGSIFSGAQTAKDTLKFAPADSSSAEGALVYETSGASGYRDRAVLHLLLGLVNDNDNAYLAIHGKGQPETIRIYTGGDIETSGQIRPGGIAMQGVFNANTANGRCVAPVGADKWAPA